MASPTGGQWLFGLPSGSSFNGLTLSTNNGTSFFPNPVTGNFNIEVFVSPTVSGAPPTTLDPGFNAGATDPGAAVAGTGFLTGSPLTLGTGNYVVVDTVVGTHAAGAVTGGSGNQTLIGAIGDSLTGGSGSQVLSAVAVGAELVTGGTGLYSVFGGAGDTILGNSGAASTTGGVIISSGSTVNTVGGGGQETIILPTAGNNLIFSGGGDTITGGATTGGGATDVFGWKNDLVNLAGDNGAVTVVGAGVIPTFQAATPGPDTMIGGSGTQALFGTAGDSIVGGSGGSENIVNATGSIVVGSGGNEIIGSGGGDTITALTGNATVLAGLGASDSANLTGNTGTENIIGAASATVTVGSGIAGVVGAASMSITLGTSGADLVIGSSVAGSGDTIKGSTAATLSYNPGLNAAGTSVVGGDLINLTGSTGNATINAFSNGTIQGAVNDTIIAGIGSDSVFGGGGDRIGTASVGGAGSSLWLHATTLTGAAMAFGTNDSVASSSTATVTVGAGNSTIGGSTATDFQVGTDALFYQNENSTTSGNIVATATSTTVNGLASSVVKLPDGTVMTLVGVTTAQLATANAAGTLFKP